MHLKKVDLKEVKGHGQGGWRCFLVSEPGPMLNPASLPRLVLSLSSHTQHLRENDIACAVMQFSQKA